MAYVSLNSDQTEVVGIFHSPQQEPFPEGYYGQMPDDDARLVAFCEANNITLPGS